MYYFFSHTLVNFNAGSLRRLQTKAYQVFVAENSNFFQVRNNIAAERMVVEKTSYVLDVSIQYD